MSTAVVSGAVALLLERQPSGICPWNDATWDNIVWDNSEWDNIAWDSYNFD